VDAKYLLSDHGGDQQVIECLSELMIEDWTETPNNVVPESVNRIHRADFVVPLQEEEEDLVKGKGWEADDGFGQSFPAICQWANCWIGGSGIQRSQHVAHDVMEAVQLEYNERTRSFGW
jgi:hypothetical protein